MKWILQILCFFNRLPIIKNVFKLISIAKAQEDERKHSMLISPSNTVVSGYFKGVKYPTLQAYGSGLFTKILGSYEDELHPLFSSIEKKQYRQILDIGCAEGFYVVGLGLKHPNAFIFAFDIDPNAIDFCKRFVAANQLKNEIEYKGFCDDAFLSSFKFESPSLIISDCEGFEKHLFTQKSMPNLNQVDVLIEIHDDFDSQMATYIKSMFAQTHSLLEIKSVLKSSLNYPILKEKFTPTSLSDTLLIERNYTQSWFFFTPNIL